MGIILHKMYDEGIIFREDTQPATLCGVSWGDYKYNSKYRFDWIAKDASVRHLQGEDCGVCAFYVMKELKDEQT